VRIGARGQIAAPPASVWEIAADPTRALDFLSGVTRWEVAGPEATGLRARYRVLFRLGPAEIGGLVEIVEFNEPHEFAWASVTGIDQRGRVRLRRAPGDRTEVELRLAYSIAGSGVSGWIAERFAAPAISAHLRRSLQQLRRQVEHEQQRERAAARQHTT
jgi:carbon monoxide dehydrogenase subunit G